MTVIGGHQRLKVLEELGYETAPCSLVNLSEDDEKMLNVALNKISGSWDNEKLEALISELDYELTTLAEFLRSNWNNPKSGNSPARGYGGVLRPVGRDENGDIVYKYAVKGEEENAGM